MNLKYYKNRWLESPAAKLAVNDVIKVLNDGGILKKELSPFGLLDNNYADFRGLDLDNYHIKKLKVEEVDLSYSSFRSSWIEDSVFKDVLFDKVDFSEITDKANIFKETSFLNCKFSNSGIGYKGSQFFDSIIENSDFTKAVFIRGEFSNCQIINCKLEGVDFNASFFKNCSFIGKLENIWFRGGYAFPSDVIEFGYAKKNQMSNVSFEKAIIEGVNFSNGCDLSTIKLPKTGNYQIFDKWNSRLEYLKKIITEWPKSQRKEAEVFVNSYLVHSKTQDWFIINIDEIQRDFGGDIVSKIIITLNEK